MRVGSQASVHNEKRHGVVADPQQRDWLISADRHIRQSFENGCRLLGSIRGQFDDCPFLHCGLTFI